MHKSLSIVDFLNKCGVRKEYEKIERDLLTKNGIKRARYMHTSDKNFHRTETELLRSGMSEQIKFLKDDETGTLRVWIDLVTPEIEDGKIKLDDKHEIVYQVIDSSQMLTLHFESQEEDI